MAFSEDGVVLIPSCPGEIVLAPMQAGRLRAALRDAIAPIDQPGVAARAIAAAPGARRMLRPQLGRPAQRVQVALDDPEPPTRPKFRPLNLASVFGKPGADDATTAPI
ncbi:MAG: hypothetical protein ACRDQB_08500 [Thermocrispum sp.]